LETPALVILLGAIEVARSAIDATTGYGEAQAEGANVVVRVRLGRPDVHVPVRFAEGVLVAPDLFVMVTATDAGDGRSAEAERGAA
jgi:hypothetical protein